MCITFVAHFLQNGFLACDPMPPPMKAMGKECGLNMSSHFFGGGHCVKFPKIGCDGN